ncbi:MAG: DUF5777 family beta-barrel protein [Bacteroidota bacterium]|nr:DUF5777 family beta-barrel protein [Bacteroidota bacterium]
MKNVNKKLLSITRYIGLCVLLLCFAGINKLSAQDVPPTPIPIKLKPVKYTFEDILLIDNQTILVPIKNTLEFTIQHRFGIVSNGYNDMYGIYAPGNIRLGFNYVPVKNLMIGFGTCKDKLQWDFNIKYALFTQSEEGGWPVSLSYFGNAVIDTRGKENFVRKADRYTYFHQLMIARKVTEKFSIQAAGSLSHFNNVESYLNSEGIVSPKMNNEHFALEFMGRYKITELIGIMVNYDQPLTQHTLNNPHPNMSFGIDFGTKGHSFQIFAGNFGNILPQNNNFYNQNDYTKGQFLIGFNITRKWHL